MSLHPFTSLHVQLSCATQLHNSAEAASHYCSRHRSSNAMATLARASQLHHHELDVRFSSPRESTFVAIYVILREYS